MTESIMDQAFDPASKYSYLVCEMMNKLGERQGHCRFLEWRMGSDVYWSVKKSVHI